MKGVHSIIQRFENHLFSIDLILVAKEMESPPKTMKSLVFRGQLLIKSSCVEDISIASPFQRENDPLHQLDVDATFKYIRTFD